MSVTLLPFKNSQFTDILSSVQFVFTLHLSFTCLKLCTQSPLQSICVQLHHTFIDREGFNTPSISFTCPFNISEIAGSPSFELTDSKQSVVGDITVVIEHLVAT